MSGFFKLQIYFQYYLVYYAPQHTPNTHCPPHIEKTEWNPLLPTQITDQAHLT